MKKNKLSVIAMILTILFLVLTAVFMILTKNNAGNSVLNKCIKAYIVFVVLYLVYIAFTAVFNSIKIKGYYTRKKFISFAITLVILSAIMLIINYVVNLGFPWYKNILVAIGASVVFFYSEAIFYLDMIDK